VIANLAETFWHGPYDLLHAIEHGIEATGPVVTWIVDTAVSAVVGLLLGLVVVAVVLGIGRLRGRTH
jgi:predicted DNA repair protein MutK